MNSEKVSTVPRVTWLGSTAEGRRTQAFQGYRNTDPGLDHTSLALTSLGQTSVSPGAWGPPPTVSLPWL